jgi:4-hydroxy-tetrahydrodipicolinate synthase
LEPVPVASDLVASPLFTGVGVALVTLFSEDGGLDAGATADHAARLAALGVRAVVVAGSTGEAAALDSGERLALLDAVRKAVPADVPVIAGTGAPSARQAAALTAAAVDHGADGVLAASPPFTADPRPYYDAVAKAAGSVPVLAYHWPALSPPGIDLAVLADLPVAGLKDSTGDAERLLAELGAWDGPVYVGASSLLIMAGLVGAAGAILALANAEPEACAAAFAGDGDAQRDLAAAHFAALRSFPRGVKELTAKRFGTSSAARMG